MNPSTRDRWIPSGLTATHACDRPGCAQPTREGKPHCAEHLEHMPYVQGLVEAMQKQRREQEAVARLGHEAVDLDGLTAQELLLHLDQSGPLTVERIARALNLQPWVASHYVEALARVGWVRLGSTARGAVVASSLRPSARLDLCSSSGERSALATG